MRIMLVHNAYLQPGGEDVAFRAELQGLRSRGIDVASYVSHNANLSRFPLHMALGTVWNAAEAKKLRDSIEAFRPQLVHFHNTFPLLSPAVYYVSKAAKVAVVQTLHNFRLICPAATLYRGGTICEECVSRLIPMPGVKHRCYRGSVGASATVAAMLTVHRALGTYAKRVDRYIALTEFAKRKLVEGGLPAEKIVVKPNFLPEDPGAGSGAGGYALFVGRLVREKGVITLLQAWKRLDKRVPLKVVGSGPLLPWLQREAGDIAGVEVMGELDRTTVLSLMKEAQMLVFPSEWYEGFPMTVLESLAVGTPIVCSGLGSLSEIVVDGRTGAHFRPADPESLADAVKAVIKHPRALAQMRYEARRAFLERYGLASNMERLLSIYHEATVTAAQERDSRAKGSNE